ncbi:MAG: glucokinase [Frankiales bacterium]|nr:glucokinase [Frankiales bacterium]
MTRLAVGVDIGGTKVAGAVVTDDGTVVARATSPTPTQELGSGAVEDALVGVITELGAAHSVEAVGIGAAGLVADGRVLYCPHLPLRGEPVAQRVSERVGLPVVLDNDANAAALGEARFGAAREAALAVCVNLGTGIGGAVLAQGHLLRGANGLAGEFGHMTISPDGLSCECRRRGCWEQYASGRALERLVPGQRGAEITAAAGSGDVAAVAALAEVGRWLGLGLANLVAAYDPDLIVVGGGVSDADALLLDPARAALAQQLFASAWRPPVPVVRAALGVDAGVVGAAALALGLG